MKKSIIETINIGKYKAFENQFLAEYFTLLAEYFKITNPENKVENKLISEKYYYNQLSKMLNTPHPLYELLFHLCDFRTRFLYDKTGDWCSFCERLHIWTRISETNLVYYIKEDIKELFPDNFFNKDFHTIGDRRAKNVLEFINEATISTNLFKDYIKQKRKIEDKTIKGVPFVLLDTGEVYDSLIKPQNNTDEILFTLKEDGLYSLKDEKMPVLFDESKPSYFIFNVTNLNTIDNSNNRGMLYSSLKAPLSISGWTSDNLHLHYTE